MALALRIMFVSLLPDSDVRRGAGAPQPEPHEENVWPCRNAARQSVMGSDASHDGRPQQETNAMQYMLMIIGDQDLVAKAHAEDMHNLMGAFMAYTRAMREAGVMIAGDPLQPVSTATTVRVRDGKTQVLDGPFAESKEQLGGYYLIDVPDLDTALSWAERCPGAVYGAIEVRPVMMMPTA
jgi:hypothetical protein